MSAKQKKMLKHFLGLLLRYCILAGLCFIIIYPLFTKIVVAFMEKGDLYDSSVVYIPKHFTLSNIRVSAETIDYGVCLIKTVLMVGGCSAMQVLSCMLTGYGFARFKIPFGRIIFGFVILTLIVPMPAGALVRLKLVLYYAYGRQGYGQRHLYVFVLQSLSDSHNTYTAFCRQLYNESGGSRFL